MNRFAKKMSCKKGFTLAETLIAGTIGSIIVMSAMAAPIMIMRATRSYEKSIDYREDVQSVITSIRHDINDADTPISILEGSLVVGDNDYLFENDGVYRDGRKISDLAFQPIQYPNHFSLVAPEGEDMIISFNYHFSSFTGGGYDE